VAPGLYFAGLPFHPLHWASGKNAARMAHAGRPTPHLGALPTPVTSDHALLLPVLPLLRCPSDQALLLLLPVLPLLQRLETPAPRPPDAPPAPATRRPAPPAPPPSDAPTVQATKRPTPYSSSSHSSPRSVQDLMCALYCTQMYYVI
jgi:hypothetical protein